MEGFNKDLLEAYLNRPSTPQQPNMANNPVNAPVQNPLLVIAASVGLGLSLIDQLNGLLERGTVTPNLQEPRRTSIFDLMRAVGQPQPNLTEQEAQEIRDGFTDVETGLCNYIAAFEAIDAINKAKPAEAAWLKAQHEIGTDIDVVVTDGEGKTDVIYLHSKRLNKCSLLGDLARQALYENTKLLPGMFKMTMDTKDPVVIEQFFKFFYTKDIDKGVSVQAVKELFQLACAYEVVDLKVACEGRLGSLIDGKTVRDLNKFAEDNHLLELGSKCRSYLYDDLYDSDGGVHTVLPMPTTYAAAVAKALASPVYPSVKKTEPGIAAWVNAQHNIGTNLDVSVTDGAGRKFSFHLDSDVLKTCPILDAKARAEELYADMGERPKIDIVLNTTDPVAIAQFFKFFYTKNIDPGVSLKAVKELYQLACTYEIANLKEACEGRLSRMLNADTRSEIEQFAIENKLPGLIFNKRIQLIDDLNDLYD